MFVAVMNIRGVVMVVFQGFMLVGVAVGDGRGGIDPLMGVVVVLIGMMMRMFMHQRWMEMAVMVALGDHQPGTKDH